MSKQCFKKAASHATLSFLLCIDKCEMKSVQPLILFLLTIAVCSPPSIILYETKIFYEGGHSIAHSIFKTCAHFYKRMKPAYILDMKHAVNFV